MWAVTVIGAPKKAAAQTIENLEKDAARLVRRRGRDALAERRHQHRHPDSHRSPARRQWPSIRSARRCCTTPIPAMEEQETRLKATGFFRALQTWRRRRRGNATGDREPIAAGAKLLLVDNDDCFIHTLANYARQTGAEVVTYRAGFPLELIDEIAPDI